MSISCWIALAALTAEPLPLAILQTPTQVAWASSWPVAVDQARAANRPLLVVFVTGWCGWSARLQRETLTDPAIVRQSAEFVALKLDAEALEGQPLARRYRVDAFPTVLVLDPAAAPLRVEPATTPGPAVPLKEVIGRVVGYLSPTALATRLATLHQGFTDRPKWTDRLARDPKDFEALLGLAELALGRGDLVSAASLIDQAEVIDPADALGQLAPKRIALGEALRAEDRLDAAADAFAKAAKTAKEIGVIIKAREGLADCRLAQGRPAEAVAELEALQSMDHLPAETAASVRALLEEARRAVARK